MKVERGFGPNLWLPRSRSPEHTGSGAFTVVEQEDGHAGVESKWRFAEDHLVARANYSPGPTARSAGATRSSCSSQYRLVRMQALLFLQKAGQDVYGVADDDRERMKLLLDNAAEVGRDERIQNGVGGLAFRCGELPASALRLGHAVRSGFARHQEHRRRPLPWARQRSAS